MASPPYHTASSPPNPTPLSLSLPRQRPALSLPRKVSSSSTTTTTNNNYPTSAHPLRQTSFPPSDSYERDGFSPVESLDSLDDADIRSAIGGGDDTFSSHSKRKRGEKRPRGRPPKDPRAHAARRNGGASSVNGSESTAKRGSGGDASILTHSDDDDDDDEAGGDGDGPGKAAGDFSLLPAEMDRDKQRKFLFREAVPPSHQARYDSFNTVKLKAGEVRKLVNNVLSQSVPANVVTVVGSYTKMFAGMLVESARECQAERLAIKEKRADGEVNEAWRRLRGMEPERVEGWVTDSDESESGEEEGEERQEVEDDDNEKQKNGDDGAEEVPPSTEDGLPDGDPTPTDLGSGENITSVSTFPQNHTPESLPETKRRKPSPLDSSLPEHDFSTVEPGAWGLGKFIHDCDRGPLQPDDLREALRRYKRSRAGGSVGFTGISLEGREGVSSRMGGRRLFR